MITAWYKQHKPLLECALRVYIAYYLADYGVTKLMGGMFNNATPEILRTELQDVDLFHLTWFLFYKLRLLSYTVGILQLLAAALLLFSRTVLWGCMIALPILINIFLIDVSVFPGPALAIRVFLYICCIMLFVLYRRTAIMAAIAAMGHLPVFRLPKARHVVVLLFALIAYLVLEIVISWVIGLVFHRYH
jgi:hypothetical protein